ncbi:MAG TPA: ferredoxin reductase [Streptosporangiaceae bacterium]|jgi:ferredoxin-NADP reductase
MARAAVLGRLTWQSGTVTAIREETATARTITVELPGWPGHLAGQHVDVRLTAPDGYTAQRSYSIASAPGGSRVDLTVQRLPDGEVSSYLAEVLEVGYPLELRGPVGGWFVWQPGAGAGPVLLVAGGSGIVPLMAMIRARGAAGSSIPFRLIYSVRDPRSVIYGSELASPGPGVEVRYVYTRTPPPGAGAAAGRISEAVLDEAGWPPAATPAVFACGPTGFVETAADLLVKMGHQPGKIKTERFGPSGGQS